MNFLKTIINIRKELQILGNLNCIGNVDETSIYFEMYNNYTVSKIGEKTVKVNNFGYEKDTVSVLLFTTANGKKLPPLIVFKGNPEGTIFKNLQKNQLVEKNKLFIASQPNSWVTEEIFYDWPDKIRFRITTIKSATGTSLIYDRAKSHFSDRINYLFKKNNANYALIPPGQTSYLQPLDVSINKPFKDYIRDKFLEFQLKNKNIKPPSKEELL